MFNLSQFRPVIQKKYKVAVSLSQMLNQCSNSLSLGDYIYNSMSTDNISPSVENCQSSNNNAVVEAMLINGQIPEGLKIGVDQAGNPAWFKPDKNVIGQYEKLKEL